MAHSLSARKRVRQNLKKKSLNRTRRATLKTRVKKVVDALVHNNPGAAEPALAEAVRTLDLAANRRTIHRNAAARKKSRLAKRLNAMKKKAAT